jgi:hypothetical protein
MPRSRSCAAFFLNLAQRADARREAFPYLAQRADARREAFPYPAQRADARRALFLAVFTW